ALSMAATISIFTESASTCSGPCGKMTALRTGFILPIRCRWSFCATFRISRRTGFRQPSVHARQRTPTHARQRASLTDLAIPAAHSVPGNFRGRFVRVVWVHWDPLSGDGARSLSSRHTYNDLARACADALRQAQRAKDTGCTLSGSFGEFDGGPTSEGRPSYR